MTTLAEKLTAAGIPFSSVDEEKREINGVPGVPLTIEQDIAMANIIEEHYRPEEHIKHQKEGLLRNIIELSNSENSIRLYPNTNDLSHIIISDRVATTDPFGEITTYSAKVDNISYVLIKSTLTDLQIDNLLSNPQTPAEVQNLTIISTIKQRFSNHMSLTGLAGRNISTINNNTDRDALIKAICIALGICDENGIILSNAINISGASSSTLGGNVQGPSKK